jgi:hypothetical protein
MHQSRAESGGYARGGSESADYPLLPFWVVQLLSVASAARRFTSVGLPASSPADDSNAYSIYHRGDEGCSPIARPGIKRSRTR